MSWTRRNAARRTAGVLAVCLACHDLQAQELLVNTSTEAGADRLGLLRSELSLARAGMGLRPVASVEGYILLGDGVAVWGATPTVSLWYRTDSGFIQGKLGWAFRDEVAVAYYGGSENGLHSGVHAEFWGDLYNAKGVVYYNWGGHLLWSHARLGRRMGELAEGGSLGLGVELIAQSETSGPPSPMERFSAVQIGPVLQWTPGAARPSFFFSGGWKEMEAGGGSDTLYLRVELSLF